MLLEKFPLRDLDFELLKKKRKKIQFSASPILGLASAFGNFPGCACVLRGEGCVFLCVCVSCVSCVVE